MNEKFDIGEHNRREDEKMAVFRLSKEARESGDEKGELGAWLKLAKMKLEDRFGVTDLTTIEGVHLRKIGEQVLKEQNQQIKKRDGLAEDGENRKAWEADLAVYEDLDKEILVRWLLQIYGIHPDQIPGGIIDDAFKEYLQKLREDSVKP